MKFIIEGDEDSEGYYVSINIYDDSLFSVDHEGLYPHGYYIHNGMDCAIDGDFHRLIIIGVDEL